MPKMSMEWHIDCLSNLKQNIQREREYLKNRMAVLKNNEEKLVFYISQIELAKERGLDGFDREKLGKKIGRR